MPSFITPSGAPCSQSDAMSAGRLKPGYKQITSDGERLGFDIAFTDTKSVKTGTYLTDTTPNSSTASIRNYARDNRLNPTGQHIPVADKALAQVKKPILDPAITQTMAVRDLAKNSRLA